MKPDSEPLVSVVVPAYNEEEHLAECIESVLAQTYQNWDLTVVDNASTDRTNEIACRYAKRDTRIRVVRNQVTVPVIENYNVAFRNISPSSTYCKVLGGDDLLFPECLTKMVAIARSNPTVAIVGAYQLIGYRLDPNGLSFPKTVVSGREACRKFFLGGPYIFGAPTMVLYRSDIVRSRQSFYISHEMHADAEVCFEFLEHNHFGFVHQVLTFTRVRDESLTTRLKKYNLYLPLWLDIYTKYGALYLTKRELRDRIKIYLNEYYNYLGCQLFYRREKAFWIVHRDRLRKLGYPLNWYRVAVNAIAYGAHEATNRIRRLL